MRPETEHGRVGCTSDQRLFSGSDRISWCDLRPQDTIRQSESFGASAEFGRTAAVSEEQSSIHEPSG
jgi:hypothetical protein